MHYWKNSYVRIVALAVVPALALAAIAEANSSVANIKIKNFGQIDDRSYRGGQPKAEDIRALANIGIETVINLRNDPESWEKQVVESAGMRYVVIPMDGHEYPSKETVETFLNVVDDPATGKFFVHCESGKHRTGAMGAVYRLTHDHWNFDQVYAEMKNYGFCTVWRHGKLKDFVQDYWNQVQSESDTRAAAHGAK